MSERVTIRQLVGAVDQTIYAGVPALKQVQSGGKISESIPEFPLVQVYLDALEASANSDTDRLTFGMRGGKPIRNTTVTVIVDVYAAQRANIGKDMLAIETMTDEVVEVLEQQSAKPLFGLPAIDAFRYSLERVTFSYAKNDYVGIRITIPLTVI